MVARTDAAALSVTHSAWETRDVSIRRREIDPWIVLDNQQHLVILMLEITRLSRH